MFALVVVYWKIISEKKHPYSGTVAVLLIFFSGTKRTRKPRFSNRSASETEALVLGSSQRSIIWIPGRPELDRRNGVRRLAGAGQAVLQGAARRAAE